MSTVDILPRLGVADCCKIALSSGPKRCSISANQRKVKSNEDCMKPTVKLTKQHENDMA